ncbi:MAG: YegP family protein [Polyangiaceae bacterium]
MSTLVSVRNLAFLAFVSFNLVACSAASVEATDSEGSAEAAVSTTARFESFVGQDGRHYWSLVAGNGENVLRSEGYASKSSANAGIASLVANGVDAESYETKLAKNGEHYFVVKADNGETVAVSETYSTQSGANRAARTVRALLLRTGHPVQSTPAPKAKRFETFLGEDGKYYFHLRAGNGEIVLASQGYATKSNATRAIATVKATGIYPSNYEVVETIDGQWSVRLVSSNGAILARGESYVSKSNANRAIDTITEIVVGGPILQ